MKKSLLITVLICVMCVCLFVGCTQPCTEHVDKNTDGKCDVCGAEVPLPEPTYSVAISNKSVTEVKVGKTLTLQVTKSPANAAVTWTSSDETVATVKDGVVTGVKEGKATVTATVKDGVSDSLEITVTDDYSVAIDKNTTVVYKGDTLALSATKHPDGATISWTSSDETVATVENGVVTALKAGKTTVTATLKEGVSDSIEITVKEYALAIQNKEENTLFVTKTLTLVAVSDPEDATITWTSADEGVVTVENGVVTAVGAGKTIVTASLNGVSDEIEITVNDTVINTSINAENFDLSGVYQQDAVVLSNGMQNSFVAFNGQAGRYYVATAVAKVSDPNAGDTWSRVGISHFNGINSYYGLQLSPGPDFNARKTVTMVITDGNVQWGIVTDRSQVWGQHALADIDFNSVKLTAVRNGNMFYAYINDKLYYVEESLEGFDGIDTLPVINLGSCSAEFSQMAVSYGEEAVNAFLATADSSVFYASYADTIIGSDGTIKFVGAKECTCNTNAKDHAAKYIGTSGVMVANVQSTVEFDLTIDAFGSRDAMPALAVTWNRYDAAAWEARSLVIAQYKAGFTGWNSNGNLPDGIGSGGKDYTLGGEAARLEEGATYHVVFTRLMYEDGQDMKFQIKDADGNVLLEDAHNWHDGYTGRVVISLLARDLDCTISNVVIASQNA